MAIRRDHPTSRPALTRYEVAERFRGFVLIRAFPETGRTHQIRVHMKYIGHTLFNDARYGGDKILKGTIYSKYKQFIDNCFDMLPRQALHAASLGFKHPRTGEDFYFEKELPSNFQDLLTKWRKYWNTIVQTNPDYDE